MAFNCPGQFLDGQLRGLCPSSAGTHIRHHSLHFTQLDKQATTLVLTTGL